MKKIYGLSALVLLTLSCFSLHSQTIFSSDFDTYTDGFPDGWNKELSSGAVWQKTEGINSLSSACQTELNGDVVTLVSNPINVEATEKYSVDFFVRLTADNYMLRIGVVYSSDVTHPDSTFVPGQIYTFASGFEFRQGAFTVPQGKTSVRLVVEIYCSSAESITAALDNLTVTKVKQSYPGYMPDVIYDYTTDQSTYSGLADMFDNPQTLDINNVSAEVFPNGHLFNNLKTSAKTFFVPKDEATSTVYAGDIWIGARDQDSVIHFAGQRFQTSGLDYFYGPVTDDPLDKEYMQNYNRIWKITDAEIAYHTANYYKEDYQMPEVIKNWPAHGNVSSNQAADLAPFFDYNGDGIYQPEQGDYPLIRGDQVLYVIFNDNSFAHTESWANTPLGVEIHAMFYAFDTTDEVLNNTVFANYKIINRSKNDYTDLRLSSFVDFDLGYAFDDYIGFDRNLNMAYAYNGKDEDGPGEGAYSGNPPAQGCMFLNRQASGFMCYNNSMEVNGEPNTFGDYYKYMHNQWKNGKRITYGGSGYNYKDEDLPYTDFMFDGDPSDASQWSEVSAGNVPGDRRGIMHAVIGDVKSQEEFCVDIAFVFAKSETGGAIASVDLLKRNAAEVQRFFNDMYPDCESAQSHQVSLADIKEEADVINIYPVPATNSVTVDLSSVKGKINGSVKVINASGQVVYQTKTQDGLVVIDLQDWESGVYYIEAGNYTGKIIKK